MESNEPSIMLSIITPEYIYVTTNMVLKKQDKLGHLQVITTNHKNNIQS